MIVFLILASFGWFFIYNFESTHYPYLSELIVVQIFFCWAYFMVCFIIFEPKKNSININFDGVFRYREISRREDYSFGFLKIIFSRNGLISLVLAIILANISIDLRKDAIEKRKKQEMYYQKERPTIQQQNY